MGGNKDEHRAGESQRNSLETSGKGGAFSSAFSSGFDRKSEGMKDPNLEDLKRSIKQAELSGVVVMIDMTASTELKMAREFPDWVPHLLKFGQIVEEVFPLSDFPDRKFLGDAFMFFFFTEESPKGGIYGDRKCYSPGEILTRCRRLMTKHWDYYRIYAERRRGSKKPVAFREITCAVDYGEQIINATTLFSDNGVLDPIGTPVDRCFRISSIAAPGQLLLSAEFFGLLKREEQEKIEKISLAPEVLKGFPDVTSVYYSIPDEDVIKHILDENQVELVEKTKHMAAKAKIRLLRRQLNAQEPRSTGGGKNEES